MKPFYIQSPQSPPVYTLILLKPFDAFLETVYVLSLLKSFYKESAKICVQTHSSEILLYLQYSKLYTMISYKPFYTFNVLKAVYTLLQLKPFLYIQYPLICERNDSFKPFYIQYPLISVQ